MIRSFKGKIAEAILLERAVPKGFSLPLAKTARRKLVQLNNAGALRDMAAPPGNRLEALKGNLAGNIQCGSTINGGSCFAGPEPAGKMSKS